MILYETYHNLFLKPRSYCSLFAGLIFPTSSDNYISFVYAHFVLQLPLLQHLSFDMLLLPVFVHAASSTLP